MVGNRPGVELVGAGDELLPVLSFDGDVPPLSLEVGNRPGLELVVELVLVMILSEIGLDVGRNVSTVNLPIVGELVGTGDVVVDTDDHVGESELSTAEGVGAALLPIIISSSGT